MQRKEVRLAIGRLRDGEALEDVARSYGVPADDLATIAIADAAGIPRFLNRAIEPRACAWSRNPIHRHELR